MTTVQSQGVPWTRSIGLAGRPYDVEIAKIQRTTLPILRNSANQSTEPGEQSISYENIWPRSQHDWRLGTNQPYFDEDDANRHRFASSAGLNPWGQRELRLHKQADLLEANTSFPDTSRLRTVYSNLADVLLYWKAGDGFLYWDNDPDTGMDHVVKQTGPDIAIADFTDDGTYIYCAMATGAVRRIAIATDATTIPAFGTFTADHVGVANGRLLATDGGRIVELDSSGGFGAAGQLDYTHPHAAFVWSFITPAPNGIYATGYHGFGSRSETYFITVNPNTGGLTTPTLAMQWPGIELATCMTDFGGVMVVGIYNAFGDAGFHLANINSDGTLTHGPLVPTTSTATSQAGVVALDGVGENVWISWGAPSATTTGLGRVWLARFTQPLVPAYATDLAATAGAGSVPAVVTRLNKVYFVVDHVGLYGESDDTYTATGTFDTGQITFGTTEKKTPVAIDWRTEPLPTGSTITVELSVNGGAFAEIGSDDTTDSTGPSTPIAIEGDNQGEDFELRFTLTRGTDPTESPVLKRWTLRSMPTPPRVDEILLPIILHGQVDPEGDLDNPYDTLAEYRFLKNLEATGSIVDLVLGSTTEKVKIDQIMFASERVIGGTSFVITWNDDHTFFNAPLTLRLLTVVPVSELS